MKRKILSITLLVSLLCSCNNRTLRSDIRKFIASFSLSESMKSYKEAGYTETRIHTTKDKVEKKVIEFSFNVKNDSLPTYQKKVTNYENDTLISKKIEKVYYENETMYFEDFNGVVSEYTLEKCSDKIRQFFYTKTELEGQYHYGGMYYGDYISQMAITLQDLVKIDEENELYKYHAGASKEGVYTLQEYSINKLGMLVENFLSQTQGDDSVVTTISVFNV